MSLYDIIIWGSGNTTELNRKNIMEENLLPKFFVDSDDRKWGSFKWDVEIIPSDEIKKRCANPMVLISSAEPKVCSEIAECLNRMEITCYHMIDEVIWGRHSEELLSVYDMLDSQYSKELFVQIILSRIEGEEIPEKYVTGNQYFAKKDFKWIYWKGLLQLSKSISHCWQSVFITRVLIYIRYLYLSKD